MGGGEQLSNHEWHCLAPAFSLGEFAEGPWVGLFMLEFGDMAAKAMFDE